MKQKESNKQPNEKQLERLKYILFPKKTQKSPLSTGFDAEVQSTQKIEKDNCTKNEIRRLRQQIYSIFNKQKKKEIEQPETERAYLDGINKICKGLKNYSNEINDVFEDFIEHLPTNLYSHKNNYTNNFFLSMVTQRCIWSQIDSLIKKPYMIAFQAIRQQSAQVKIQRQSQIKMKSQREMKHKYQTYIHLNKYFSVWRFKSKCVSLQILNQQHIRQNNLENDRKIVRSALQIPMYILLLEQIIKDSSDITQILLYDDKTKKLCKFLEDSQQYLNSSIETVTHRSLLHGQTANKKFKRYQFDIVPSITKLCLDRKQILFIPNLYKHPDFNEIDAVCHCQPIDRCKGQFAKGGVILYPLFNSNCQLLGVLRQYFLQKGLKAIHSSKIYKTSMLLELSVTFEQHSRKIQKQNNFLKNNYYQKMIRLIKHLQSTKGEEKTLLQQLEKELISIFQIDRISVYNVEKREEITKDSIVLRNIWGKNEGCHILLSLVDKLMNQECNYVYLEKRLLFYANMMLFDLHLNESLSEIQTTSNKLLPVDLIGTMIIKVQSIIKQKNELFKICLRQEQLVVQNQRKQILQKFTIQSQKLSLSFLSNIHSDKYPFKTTQNFIIETLTLYQKLFGISNQTQKRIIFWIEMFPKQRKQAIVYKLSQESWEKNTQKQFLSQLILIQINKLVFLKIQCEINEKQVLNKVKPIIQTYFMNYLKLNNTRLKQSLNFQQFQFKLKIIIHQFKSKIQFSESSKKNWQLKHLSLIYSTFKEILQQFISIVYKKNQKIEWNRNDPTDTNRQQWKQIIYQFVLNEPKNIVISLNPTEIIQNLKQKIQFQLLCNQTIASFQQSSELALFISKNHFQSKMSYDSPLIFRLPILFPFDQPRNDNNLDQRLNSTLLLIKNAWLQLCKSLIEGNNKINLNSKIKATKMKFNALEQAYDRIKNSNFSKLKSVAIYKIEIDKNKLQALKMMQKILIKSIWKIFTFIKNNIKVYQQNNKLIKINRFPLDLITNCLKNKVLGFSFSKISQRNNKMIGINSFTKTIDKLINKKLQENRVESFLQIFQKSKLSKSNQLVFNILNNIYKLKLIHHFNKLKLSNWSTSRQNQNIQNFQILPQQITSIKQLQQILIKMVPQFKLFLIIDSHNCFTLTPINNNKKIISFEEVNNIQSPFLMYQIGSQCQLVWHYLLKQSEDCFRIKDKLNNISKFVEQALKNCRELMTKNIVRLMLLKGKWKQSIKCKYLKLWREESDLQGNLQRNRLNDCLYQLSLESQTMKQKLKSQQKMLKNNLTMYQQILNKKGQYKRSIQFSDSEIIKIEDSFSKLENARILYMTLHKRAVFKSCLLIWRVNSKKLKIEYFQQKMKKDSQRIKVGLKTILSILNPRYQQLIRKSFSSLQSVQNYNIKKKQIEKIKVVFQQNSQRLITFQSELGDKQNQSQNSFLQQSPQSKHCMYKGLNRPNQLKAQSRMLDLSNQELSKYNNGAYKLNPKTLKFLKRMGKLQN